MSYRTPLAILFTSLLAFSGLDAGEITLEEHPEAMRKLTALHLRATEMLRNEPERAEPHVRDFVGRSLIDLATVKAALSSPFSNYMSYSLAIREGTRRMRDVQLSQGILREEIDLDTLFDTRLFGFFDTSSGGKPSHVDIYLGEGQMIHAPPRTACHHDLAETEILAGTYPRGNGASALRMPRRARI